MEADKDGDGKLSFEEFTNVVSNTVRYNTDLSSIGALANHAIGYR